LTFCLITYHSVIVEGWNYHYLIRLYVTIPINCVISFCDHWMASNLIYSSYNCDYRQSILNLVFKKKKVEVFFTKKKTKVKSKNKNFKNL
jgi:hypothetical protein